MIIRIGDLYLNPFWGVINSSHDERSTENYLLHVGCHKYVWSEYLKIVYKNSPLIECTHDKGVIHTYIKNSRAHEFYCPICGVILDMSEDKPIISKPRRLAKNERICRYCGRIFRKRRNENARKYCSKDCSDKANKRRMRHRNGLGSFLMGFPDNNSLSPSNISKMVRHIKNWEESNDDLYTGQWSNDSKHSIVAKKTVYRNNGCFYSSTDILEYDNED